MSDATLAHPTSTNGVKNITIVVQHVKLINDILGKSLYSIKGKAVRGQPAAVKTEVIPLPNIIIERYSIVKLCVDLMSVN